MSSTLTPAKCGQAVCGETICGRTNDIVLLEFEEGKTNLIEWVNRTFK